MAHHRSSTGFIPAPSCRGICGQARSRNCTCRRVGRREKQPAPGLRGLAGFMNEFPELSSVLFCCVQRFTQLLGPLILVVVPFPGWAPAPFRSASSGWGTRPEHHTQLQHGALLQPARHRDRDLVCQGSMQRAGRIRLSRSTASPRVHCGCLRMEVYRMLS